MRDTAFSVVMPLFDKRDFVLAALDTAFSQTLPPAEVIVIDDGSRDGGGDLVAALSHPLIRLRRQDNAGPGPARNRGVAAARADWIAFLDADDLWAADHLERLADTIAQVPTAGLVCAGFRRVEAAHAAPPRAAGPTEARAIDFFAPGSADRVWTSAVAARRSALDACGGFAAFPAGEDVDLWIRLAMTQPMAAHPAVTAHYRRDTGGVMAREYAAARAAAPPPSPVFATIAALLAEPRHAARHAALRAYGDDLRVRFARQRLHAAQPHAARTLLAPVSTRGALWWRWWPASWLPAPLIRTAIRMRQVFRRKID